MQSPSIYTRSWLRDRGVLQDPAHRKTLKVAALTDLFPRTQKNPRLDPSNSQELVKRPEARLGRQDKAQLLSQDFNFALGTYCALRVPGPAQNAVVAPAFCRSKDLPGR